MWGQLITDSTNMCRFNANIIAPAAGSDSDVVRSIHALVACFPHLLKNFLRGEFKKDREDLEPFVELHPTLVTDIMCPLVPGPGRCRWVITLLSRELARAQRSGHISDNHQMYAENLLAKDFTAVLGTCSRILSTPLNFAVALHIRTILALFYVVTPVVLLANGLSFAVCVLASGVIVWATATVDEVALAMETPFGKEKTDLPLEAFCNLILRNTSVFINLSQHLSPTPAQDEKHDAH